MNPALNFFFLWEFLHSLFSGELAISIGSGNGTTEAHIASSKKTRFICCDPDPTSFQNDDGPQIPPHFPTVDHFLANCKDVPDVALLCWPSPNIHQWDMEAIAKLATRGVRRFVLVLETCGGAGSHLLNYWLQHYVNHNGNELAFCDVLRHTTGDPSMDEVVRMMYSAREFVPTDEDKDVLERMPKCRITSMKKQEVFKFKEALALQAFMMTGNPVMMANGWDQSCWTVMEMFLE